MVCNTSTTSRSFNYFTKGDVYVALSAVGNGTYNTLSLFAGRLSRIFSDLNAIDAVHDLIGHTFTLIEISSPVVPSYIIAARKAMDVVKMAFIFGESSEIISYFCKKSPGKAPKLEIEKGIVVSVDTDERLATANKTMAERHWSKKPFLTLGYAALGSQLTASFVQLCGTMELLKLADIASAVGNVPYIGSAIVAGTPFVVTALPIAAYSFFTLNAVSYCFAAWSDDSKDMKKGLLDLATRAGQLAFVVTATFATSGMAPMIAVGGIGLMSLYLVRFIYIQERKDEKSDAQQVLAALAEKQIKAGASPQEVFA